jgi:hypothetical protein
VTAEARPRISAASTRRQALRRLKKAVPPIQKQAPRDEMPLELRPLRADAALYWVNGQYLFKWMDGATERSKCIAPASVRSAFSREPVDSGWLPPHTVRCGSAANGDYEVLFFPPQRIPVRFVNGSVFTPLTAACAPEARTSAARAPQASRILTIELPMPALLFIGFGQTYAIYAAAARAFAPDMPLFHAPLPNVSAHGLICFGETQPPPAGQGRASGAWQTFCDSPFTDHGVDGKSRRHADDIRQTLVDVAADCLAGYPTDDLVPLNFATPECAVRNLLQGGRYGMGI